VWASVWAAWRALAARRASREDAQERRCAAEGLDAEGRLAAAAAAAVRTLAVIASSSASQSHTASPTFVDTLRPALSAPRASTPPHYSSA